MTKDGARQADHDVEGTIARIAQRVFTRASLPPGRRAGSWGEGAAICERTGLMFLLPPDATDTPNRGRHGQPLGASLVTPGRSLHHADVRAAGATALGQYLAVMAELEEASVTAFEVLARELAAHGAPDDLIADAIAAQKLEVRHAAMMGALARARGGVPRARARAQHPVRSLEDVAQDNAVEGCVRETYAALIGLHQAAFAADEALRCAMVRIAAEEARHAALAHRIHAWIMPLLDEAMRARVHAAQRAAIASLDPGNAHVVDGAVVASAGLPHPARARLMLRELASTLWSSALAGG